MTEFLMISITDEAIKHLLNALETYNTHGSNDNNIRLSVSGGGCGGFKYDWSFSTKNDGDVAIPLTNEVSLVVGNECMPLLEGSVIDLVTVNALTKEIKITNPNACNKCGCGKSFS